jgi:hypothetical protein
MKSIPFLVVLFLIVTSCGFNKKGSQSSSNTVEKQELNANSNSHEVTVTEFIQTGSYTYVKLKEGSKEYWAAVPRFEAKTGQKYYYNKAMEMIDFKSKELNRTFSSIWFLEGLSDKPITAQNPPTLTTAGKQTLNRVTGISVRPAEGGITISKLMSDKAKFANKKIKVSGQVVKFSPEIMNKNWVHLQDGTEASGQYDLVITTNDNVRVGDVVTFEGRISLDKDFGYGYKYDVLMEEAGVLASKKGL